MASSFAQSHSELQFAHHYTRQMHGNQLSMASPYSRPSALSPTPCLPPPQDSSTIKLNIIQNGEWRSYKVPFTRVKSYSNFVTAADDILKDCIPTDATPAPGKWIVVDLNGSIIHPRFWEDLVSPDAIYCLVPTAVFQNQEKEPVSPTTSGTSSSSAADSLASSQSQTAKTYAQVLLQDGTPPPAPVSPLLLPKKRPHPGPHIKITVRNTRFNIVDTKSVPLSWTVGQLIEEMGGRYGARIQELRHVAGGGFTPGLTFMFGTKKTVAETGWKGNIQLCLHQARN